MSQLETLARIDNGERSVRIERSSFVSPSGPRTVLLITTYRLERRGRWVRTRSVTVRRAELAELSEMLGALARKEPVAGQ